MKSVLVSSLLLLTFTHGWALESESKSPYILRVVLHTADHPSLTPQFRAELGKNVRLTLQNSLGAFAKVELLELKQLANGDQGKQADPLCQLVLEKGLDALDGYRECTGVKTHFVLMDIVDGQYEMRLRQHDGSTGIATPVIRTHVEGDRQSVVRVICRTIGEDFGFVGTFSPEPNGVDYALTLKAGELKSPEDWIKEGDLFAVVQIRSGNSKPSRPTKGKGPQPPTNISTFNNGQRLEWAFMQVKNPPKSGTVICTLWSRFTSPFARDGRTVGYRAIKLGTSETTARIRLVDQQGKPMSKDSIRVRIGEKNFPNDRMMNDQEIMTINDGIYSSKRPLQQIGFLLVTSINDAILARIPVDLYQQHVHTIRITLDANADRRKSIEAEIRGLQDRVRVGRILLGSAVREVSDQQKTDKPKALQLGEAAVEFSATDTELLKADIERLKKRLGKDAPAGSIEACENDLKLMVTASSDLKEFLKRLKRAIELDNDPTVKLKRKEIETLIVQIEADIKQFNYELAIEKYQQVIKLSSDEPDIKAQFEKALAGIEDKWKTKDAEHAAARKFIYQHWAKWEKPAEMRDGFAELKNAVKKCQAVGDQISLGKLLSMWPQVSQNFQDKLKELVAETTDDDEREKLKAFEPFFEELGNFLQMVENSLK